MRCKQQILAATALLSLVLGWAPAIGQVETGAELEECRQGLEVAWNEMESLKTELEASEETLRALERENGNLQEQLTQRNELLLRIKQVAVRQREKIEKLTTAHGEASGEVRAALKETERRVEELEAALEQAESENADSIASLERQIEEQRATIEELESQDSEKTTDRKAASLSKRVKKLEAQLDERDAKFVALEEERKEKRKEVKQLKRDLDKASEGVAPLEKELAKLQEQLETKEAVLEENRKEIADLRVAIAARDELLKSNKVRPRKEEEGAGAEASPLDTAAQPEPPTREIDDEAGASPYRLIVEGNRALREDHIAEAEKLFNRALAEDPSLVGARLGLASCYYSRSDLPQAKRLVAEVLRVDPKNPHGLGLSGIIAWQEGDLEKASRDVNRAIKLEPNEAQLQNYAGIIFHAQRDYHAAIKALRRAVELDPNHGQAMFNLSVLLATSKNPNIDEAKEYYEKARKLGSVRDEKLEEILYP